jgi:large subunit ribosomal protein L25
MSIKIKAEKRDVTGKNVNRRIRREGRIPAVLYGANMPNVSLTLDKMDVLRILKSETGENTIFKVSFDSDSKDTMIKELQRDPVSDEILHADLILIRMDKEVRIAVPVLIEGEAIGVKSEGGFVDLSLREIEVECLPGDIPEHIEIDISKLHLHQSVRVEDLTVPEGVKIVSDSHSVVVLIEAPTKEEIEVPEEEEEEVMAEEEEPEVIKKEKVEEEEEKKEE